MIFPLNFIPKESYKKGGHRRWFGAERDGGRLHAACDLIAPVGAEVFAIEDGVVIEPSRSFYHGVNVIAVRHQSGLVVRYGEIKGETDGMREGSLVKEGQVMGHVGMMEKDHMLHFELYSGTASGNLMSSKTGPYQRRADLIDPTPLFDRLAAQLLGKQAKT
jgi:murein DD-endopeptidase MepM/ murein hydrolase activator NlpD